MIILKFSQTNIFYDLNKFKSVIIFCPASSGCRVVSNFVIFLLSYRRHLGPMLPPVANVIKLFTVVSYAFS